MDLTLEAKVPLASGQTLNDSGARLLTALDTRRPSFFANFPGLDPFKTDSPHPIPKVTSITSAFLGHFVLNKKMFY